MAIDETTDTAYVHGDWNFSPSAAIIYEVDLFSGNRQIISSATVGTGPLTANTFKMAFNPIDRKLYSVNLDGGGRISSLAVDTGERALVSDDTRGTGWEFSGLDTLGKLRTSFLSTGYRFCE